MADEGTGDDASVESEAISAAWSLAGRHVAFLGRLGGLTRREAPQWVREQRATPVELSDPRVDLVVIGAEELPLGEGELLDQELELRAASGAIEIVSENELWQRLGYVESDQDVRRLYTPAMLAHFLKLPVATIRRWHRRGLIVPVREVHRLPYFDFQEVATARRLSELVSAGVSPAAIERKLNDLARLVPGVQRPLAQLSVIVEGGELLVRRQEGLIDPRGQRRIDFEALETDAMPAAAHAANDNRTAADEIGDRADEATGEWSGEAGGETEGGLPQTPEELAAAAGQLEEEGRLAEATEMYRAALAAGGPRAEYCFHLAELLYRLKDLPAARERYYMALEIDEDYVEARANLGCILAETGHPELAISAFEGALRFHPDYPDAHYHLAKLVDESGDQRRARRHWQAFLRLAPDSPWADEARSRLGEA